MVARAAALELLAGGLGHNHIRELILMTEEEILALCSTPGLRRNSLEQEQTYGHDQSSQPVANNEPPELDPISEARILAGFYGEPDPLYSTPQTATSLRSPPRCEWCGQDLEYRDAVGRWHRSLCHRDGTGVRGQPDRPSAGVEAGHLEATLDDRPSGD